MTDKKDLTRLGVLVALTSIFWVTSMVNANARVYYIKRDCNYENVLQERLHDQIKTCIDTMDNELHNINIQVDALIKRINEQKPLND